jgi:L-seryl-tRNA(Ser) seleniumtransferase
MDLGSGCLVDLSPYGLERETTVQSVIAAGVDVVSFSGDKLLGGPQAGILAGRADLIEQMRSNPLARALRMDKLTLAALEATLLEYTSPQGPADGVPTLAMIMKPREELEAIAETIAAKLRTALKKRADVSIVVGVGRVGGGALPLEDLPGPRVSVRPRGVSAGRLEQALRAGDPPMIALVKDDAILIDPRTLLQGQPDTVATLVSSALDRAEAV